ncbi:MAG: PilZ domain-containing protein [Deltaproteobacteria bacterium]|nr:PilZ domain-containing protein [Deltaproteobacteria bacterium]MBW2157288.1 PilZ domain-containing protein [Deltaproteobacteria bacterium]MBW2326921.1 PilZ domain-containing protein [Deltaproteobacteria bacterium]
MKERRQHERFTFPLPVRLETITLDRKKVLDLVTRDISNSGTFITTLTSFPEGTRFILDFTIPSDSIKGLKDVKSLRGFTGSMVRYTPYGLAIQFDSECQLESLKAL